MTVGQRDRMRKFQFLFVGIFLFLGSGLLLSPRGYAESGGVEALVPTLQRPQVDLIFLKRKAHDFLSLWEKGRKKEAL